MSFVDEVKKGTSKSKNKKIVVWILLILVAYFTYSYFYNSPEEENLEEEKKYSVITSDIKNSIESDWRVILKDEINIDFINPWIIKDIYKKEWDEVKVWDIIATLDSSYLDLSIEKAKIALSIAEANYNLKKRWGTISEINISQKQLESSKASYDATLAQGEMDIKIAEDGLKIALENVENIKKQAEVNKLNAINNLETSKLDLQNLQNNLKLTETQELQKYQNTQNKVVMEAWQLISIIEKNLFDIDVLLGISDSNRYLNDSFETYLWAKNTSYKTQAENSYREAKAEFDKFYTNWKTFRQNGDLSLLSKYITDLKNSASLTNKTLNYTISTLKNSISSSSFSQTTLDSNISNFENALLNLKNESSAFAITTQTLEETKTSMDYKIASLNDSTKSLEQKIKINEANLEKVNLENEVSINTADQKLTQAKIALENAKIKNETWIIKEKSQVEISKSNLDSKTTSDQLELEPLYMAILNAKKNLEEAIKKKDDSILKSPISWKIVNISRKIWESVWQTSSESFVTIINDKTFFVEVQAEEEDIIKIKNGQKTYISFDAIDWIKLEWEVVYVNDKATIDTNWVVSYKTEVIFTTEDKKIREWMTATVEFITKEVKNVLTIPVQAVKTVNKKPSVKMENWEYRSVITGFTDAKVVEVISWLKKWDVILY